MKKPIERILVPVYYSEPAFHAAWIALAIARSMQASMTLMHIHIQENALRETIFIDPNALTGLTDEKFHDLLLKLVGDPSYKALQATADHSVIEFEPCSHTPSHEICDYARENKIDLIVMGSHCRSNIEELLVGSVSFEVVRKAPCPVAVVH